MLNREIMLGMLFESRIMAPQDRLERRVSLKIDISS